MDLKEAQRLVETAEAELAEVIKKRVGELRGQLGLVISDVVIETSLTKPISERKPQVVVLGVQIEVSL